MKHSIDLIRMFVNKGCQGTSGWLTVILPFLHYSEQFYLPTSCTAQNYNVKIKVWMKLKFLQIRQFKLNA